MYIGIVSKIQNKFKVLIGLEENDIDGADKGRPIGRGCKWVQCTQ